ncbi:MAG: hypothetical protein IIB67_10785 [Proteobacteria bacterium]|nr:hypothetical protein [Pseudomonadota bacterium]
MKASELILRYTLSHPYCHTTIVGTRNPAHLLDNLAAAAQVWRLHVDDKPIIRIGESLTFLAVGEGDVIAAPRVPLHTTDFTVNTESGGAGTDLLASVQNNSGTVSASGS